MGIDPNLTPKQTANGSYLSSSPSSSRKRKRAGATDSPSHDLSASYPNHYDEYSYEGDMHVLSPKVKKAKKVNPVAPVNSEKRLRRFRERPPASFDAIYERATTQRFFVLSRIRSSTDGCPEEHLEITGSTGNIYNVHIARQPTCDCPHSRAGNQCKHVTFVLSRVLRAKYEYVYQLALLSDELREIFRTAPAPVGDQASSGVTNKNRKPIEGDCPICFEEMKEGPGNEKLVWCKAACGQNIHRQCFNTWAKTKRQNAGPSAKVPCPYCRSTFEIDDTEVNLASIKKTGTVGEDGYVNVADQLGISSARDHSSYSRFWSGHSWAYRHGSFR